MPLWSYPCTISRFSLDHYRETNNVRQTTMTIQPSQVKLTINLISQGSVSVLYASPLCKSTIIFIMIFSLSPRHRTIGFTLNETGNDALCASFCAWLGKHRFSPFSVVSHFLVMQLFSFTIFFCCNCSMYHHAMSLALTLPPESSVMSNFAAVVVICRHKDVIKWTGSLHAHSFPSLVVLH